MVNEQDARLYLTVLVTLRDIPDHSMLTAYGLKKSEAGICDGARQLLHQHLNTSVNRDQRFVILNEWTALRDYLFRHWPEFSGRVCFPIMAPKERRAFDPTDIDRYAYLRASKYRTMWQGEYGEARYRLLNYMIEELQRAHPSIDVVPAVPRTNDRVHL